MKLHLLYHYACQDLTHLNIFKNSFDDETGFTFLSAIVYTIVLVGTWYVNLYVYFPVICFDGKKFSQVYNRWMDEWSAWAAAVMIKTHTNLTHTKKTK